MHPVTGRPWPAMPRMLLDIWADVAGYPAPPEACLVNLYGPARRWGRTATRTSRTSAAPVVSISLGDSATFHVGGLQRAGPKQRMILKSGDVVVLGGAARMPTTASTALPRYIDPVAGGRAAQFDVAARYGRKVIGTLRADLFAPNGDTHDSDVARAIALRPKTTRLQMIMRLARLKPNPVANAGA